MTSQFATLFVAYLYLLYSPDCFAIPESNYQQDYQNLVEPFYEAGESGFLNKNKITLFYKFFSHPNPKAQVVVAHGWSEDTKKYAEFSYDLYKKGISTYLLDFSGFGKSSRLATDPQISYIKDYRSYVDDFDLFLNEVVIPKIDRSIPLVAVAHSMGANIVTLYAVEKPKIFDRMILSSPMLDIISPLPHKITWIVAKIFEFLGFGDSYIVGHGPYMGTRENNATSSRVRFDQWIKDLNKDQIKAIAGASYSWLAASMEATQRMKAQATNLSTPILMLQAGDDVTVETKGQNEICKKAKNCFKMVFPDGKHELLQERDTIRNKVISEVIDYAINYKTR